jgi:hypothetical protein
VNPDIPPLELHNIGPGTVTDLFKSLDNKSGCDIDGISTSLLKHVVHEVCTPLAHIFNLSLSSGIFPDAFKTSRIVPVHKTGDTTNCDNYRPIALVSTISKILEKLVANYLTNHLELNNLIYSHQYGFLKGRSTEHNLLHVLNHISTTLNNGDYCIGVFLDLKKAFDTCNHNILLGKLEKLGITGTPLQWFETYLKDRRQKVDINGSLSNTETINISVLQSTILGPLLFL